MNNTEIEAVHNLSASKRYEYFIKKVADFGEVWRLYDDGWAISEEVNGNPLMPFWPKKEFANLCAVDEWKNYKAEQIELEDFMQKWLPGLKSEGIQPSIFWNNVDSAVLDIDTLILDLEDEIKKY
ncbi:DUF2750 domain-containing protein [Lysinibacillus sp. SGAir0095]|uniref:DUF2750 domain-containing protein n=1 Tax=Lysinibacillus sp. SGAir0095 TaxID=2070463 RepID=UPI0010CD50D6|nr:DUF2750 domain-containing protein [Lysinibacillus sp. SGAir0095]QCR31905.1 DUF2750 domain-containing protein [Lysinibacillus sp. SGAir0095]